MNAPIEDQLRDYFQMVERPDITVEELEDSPEFESMGPKLCAALSKTFKGEAGRAISLKVEEMAKRGEMMPGRVMLYHMYRRFDLHQARRQHMGYSDLMNVKWLGDKNLEAFNSNWDHVCDTLITRAAE